LITNLEILKNYSISLFIFLLVFSYSFLPVYFLPVESSYLIFLSFIILVFFSVFSEKKSLTDINLFYWYLVFLVWYTLRLLFSNNIEFSLIDLRPIYLLNTACIFFCVYYSYLRSYIKNILITACLFYALFASIAFYDVIVNNSFNGFVNIFEKSGWDASGENIYQNMGMWFSISFIISAFGIKKNIKKSKLKFFAYGILFFTSSMLLLLSGARAALVGAIFGLFYLIKNVRVYNLIIALFFCSVIFIPIILSNQELLLTISRLSILFYGGDDSERIFLFTNALNLWSQDISNIFFGAGVKSFPAFIGSNSPGNYPHNIFLEVLSELGLVGIFIFSQIFYSAFKKENKDVLMTSLAICFTIIYCFTGGIHKLYDILFFLSLSSQYHHK